MLRTFLLISVISTNYTFGYEDLRSKVTIELEDSLFVLNNQGDYNASYKLIQNFRKNEKLTPDDNYYGLLYLSFLYKRLFDYDKVQTYLDSAEFYIPNTSNPEQFEVNQRCQKSFAYFDVQAYDLAYQIMREIEPKVESNLSNEDLSIYYMQQGYINFLNGNFELAEEKLTQSEQIMAEYAAPHLPIVYTKKMELYAAMGQDSLMEVNFEKSLNAAITHGIKKYEILTYLIRKNIAEKEKDFDSYLEYDLMFDQAENEYNSNQHLLEIAEAEKQYELKISALKLEQTNLVNRRLVYFSLFVCLVLIVVIFFWRRLDYLGKLLKIKHDELTELDKLNKEIFSIISHDLKEPLLSINFFLDKIKRNGVNEATPIIADLENQIHVTSTILQDLLTWSASELLVNEDAKETVRVQEIVKNTTQYYKQIIDRKNISINFINKQQCVLQIDPWVFAIVMRNLLSNALKFSDKGGKIQIVVEADSISIIDEGIGLKPSLFKSNFDKRQNPGYGTLGESGFGIGLYLSQVLLARNGFYLKAGENLPKGAIFQVLKN